MQAFARNVFWAGLIVVAAVPVVAALKSPLLEWRDPVYIVAGVAGITALALLLFQPLLACGFLPGLSRLRSKQFHRWAGFTLLSLVLAHVVGLWFTSPPDVVDALLFRSPTSFSPWGVISMWALFAAAVLVGLRMKLKWPATVWRAIHLLFAVTIVIGTVVHALLIDGTMEIISKWILCTAVVITTVTALIRVSGKK